MAEPQVEIEKRLEIKIARYKEEKAKKLRF